MPILFTLPDIARLAFTLELTGCPDDPTRGY
jgi:hypothetical protein